MMISSWAASRAAAAVADAAAETEMREGAPISAARSASTGGQCQQCCSLAHSVRHFTYFLLGLSLGLLTCLLTF